MSVVNLKVGLTLGEGGVPQYTVTVKRDRMPWVQPPMILLVSGSTKDEAIADATNRIEEAGHTVGEVEHVEY